MFAFRDRRGRVEVGFTDRIGPAGPLDLALPGSPPAALPGASPEGGLRVLEREFGGPVLGMTQVHGAEVFAVGEEYDGSDVVADGLVTARPGLTLLVRVADCVPVLLADAGAGVIGVAHAGRLGLVAGVVPTTVAALRVLGGANLEAWVGPHICGRCYEVPEQLRADVTAAVPHAWSETSWGTPAVDIGAGVRAQLEADGVVVHDVARCTLEHDELWSYRRDGDKAGRMGGVIRMAP